MAFAAFHSRIRPFSFPLTYSYVLSFSIVLDTKRLRALLPRATPAADTHIDYTTRHSFDYSKYLTLFATTTILLPAVICQTSSTQYALSLTPWLKTIPSTIMVFPCGTKEQANNILGNTPTITRIHHDVAASVAFMMAGDRLDANLNAKNRAGWSQPMYILFDLLDIIWVCTRKDTLSRFGPGPCHDWMSDIDDRWTDCLGKNPPKLPTRSPRGIATRSQNVHNAQYISATEKVYTFGCPTSHRIWLNLQSMHNHRVVIDHFPTSLATTFAEGGDIYTSIL